METVLPYATVLEQDAGRIAMYMGFLGGLHLTAHTAAKTLLKCRGMSQRKIRGFSSRVVCLVHCLVSSVGAMTALAPRFVGGSQVYALSAGESVCCTRAGAPPVMTRPRLAGGYTDTDVALVAIEIGELLYMTGYDLMYEPGVLELAHHILGLVAEVGCLIRREGLTFMVWVHLSQITQPFLYVGWMLMQLNATSSFVFKSTSGVVVLLCTPRFPRP